MVRYEMAGKKVIVVAAVVVAATAGVVRSQSLHTLGFAARKGKETESCVFVCWALLVLVALPSSIVSFSHLPSRLPYPNLVQ